MQGQTLGAAGAHQVCRVGMKEKGENQVRIIYHSATSRKGMLPFSAAFDSCRGTAARVTVSG